MSFDEKKEFNQEEDTQKGRFLTFKLGEESFGLEIRYVTEIVGIQPITQIPEVPKYVKGIINLRGKVISVIDVRIKFKKEPIEYDERTCIVVIEIDDISIGLIVDNVSEVVTINDDDIAPPPSYKTGFQNRYIKGVGKSKDGVELLLDCNKLLTNEEKQNISDIEL
ncbi:MAG TPA: chemotaxis protein CheW [Anaerovoracaceae bacterium]|nr:chemotaxis protein CheW [Anaerovoracaceae bacterium]